MVRTLYSKIEHIFGEEMLGAYTQASTELDMFLLAYTIYSSDLAVPQGLKQLAGLKLFNFYDILYINVNNLAEKIKEFNRIYIWDLHLAITSYPPLDINDLTGFVDIQKFINVISDRLEEVDFTFELNAG